MTDKILLFVYGTLRPSVKGNAATKAAFYGGNHVGRATVKGHLYNIGWYPGAIFNTEASGAIVGDILELPEAALTRLDRYEGCVYPNVPSNLYNRVKVLVDQEVSEEEGKTRGLFALQEVECWAYEYNNTEELGEDNLIASGDWFSEAAK
jgi:gamma-glutamylcyclotransferase (GGCT)/AIG2-like uncharacterized protein YtfP